MGNYGRNFLSCSMFHLLEKMRRLFHGTTMLEIKGRIGVVGALVHLPGSLTTLDGLARPTRGPSPH
jgi:hypothetical protein